MELKWTSKALSDLARLYDFLVLASKPAAARTVQSLTQAPVILLTHPRMGDVNATMFDRYLPFSCPLKYFRY